MKWMYSATGREKRPCGSVKGLLKHHATIQSFQPKHSCDSEFQRFCMLNEIMHILFFLSKAKVKEFCRQNIEELFNQIDPVKRIQKSYVWIHSDGLTYIARTLRSKKEETAFFEPSSQKWQENIQIHSLQIRMFVACILTVYGEFER